MSDHSTSLDGGRRGSYPLHCNIGEEESSLQIQRNRDVLSMSTTNHINGSTHIGSHEYQRRHSTNNNNNNNNLRRRGMNTKDACEVNRRRRSIVCAEEEENDKPPRRKSRKRKSVLDGIRFGAAAIRRDDGEVGIIDDSHRSVGSSKGRTNRRRRSSISAGEGVWLIKDNVDKRRQQNHRRSYEHQTISSSYEDNNNNNNNNNLNYDDNIQSDLKAPPTSALNNKLNGKRRSSSPPIGSSIPKHNNNKTVSFSTVSVRYHPIILGNNRKSAVCTNTCDNHLSFVFIKCDNAHLPAFVTSGPPLELGWDWEHESSMNEVDIPIDDFEATYSPHRRSEWDLALSRGERETQLLELGFTREEIAAAIRETSKIKSQRANTVLNIKMAGIEEATEQLRTKGLELIGLRKNPDWLYNEWKNSAAHGPRPLNAKRAGSIYRREGDRAAAAIVSELQSSLDYRGTSKLIRNVVRRIKRGLSSGDEYTVGSPSEDADDGPPFGITRKSFISRTPRSSTLNSDEGMLWPFAIIEVVHPNSPAHEAKLNKGDRIIKLGNITALTSDHGRSIPALGQVAAKKDESLLMEVENIDGVRRACTIRPRNNWGGRGCYGFLFRELGE